MLGLFIIHHNANGNLTSDGVWSYTYDYENRLVQASNGTNTIAYTYDARGRLIERRSSGNSVTTNRMYYVGWQMIADYDGVGNMRRKYVYGVDIDEPVRMTGSGTNYYYHADALGSITEITGSTGALVESYTYDVYGAPTIYNSSGAVTNASAIGNRRFFTGRNRDGETGLYNLRNRCYSPTLGRFMQTDPSGLAGGDLNLYRYCGNNPVNSSDPMGLFSWQAAGVTAVAAIGITAGIVGSPFVATGAAVGLAGYGIAKAAIAVYDATSNLRESDIHVEDQKKALDRAPDDPDAFGQRRLDSLGNGANITRDAIDAVPDTSFNGPTQDPVPMTGPPVPKPAVPLPPTSHKPCP